MPLNELCDSPAKFLRPAIHVGVDVAACEKRQADALIERDRLRVKRDAILDGLPEHRQAAALEVRTLADTHDTAEADAARAAYIAGMNELATSLAPLWSRLEDARHSATDARKIRVDGRRK